MADPSVVRPKLAVGYPWSSPFTFTAFTETMLNLRHPAGWDVRFFRGTGWCPARRHIDLCEQALAWGADYILIVGADQVHPEDMLERLIARVEEGYTAVAALVPARGYLSWQPMKPFQPMAWRFRRAAAHGVDPGRQFGVMPYRGQARDGDRVEVIVPTPGRAMERVDFIGSGVLLVHRDHVLALEPPWFHETIDPKTFHRIANQDATFVWRLKIEAGVQVWLDTTIEVEHAHVFRIDRSYQERFADWANGHGDPTICRYAPAERSP